MAWTLEQAKTILGIPTDDTSKDAAITAAMTVSVAMVETFCDRKVLAESDFEETAFDLTGSVLQLSLYPITTLTSLDFTSLFGDANPITGYRVDKRLGRVLLADIPGDGTIVATYDGGYAPTALPPDLEAGMWGVFGVNYGSDVGTPSGSAGGGVTSIQIPDVGTVRFDAASVASTGGSYTDVLGPQWPLLVPYVRPRA